MVVGGVTRGERRVDSDLKGQGEEGELRQRKKIITLILSCHAALNRHAEGENFSSSVLLQQHSSGMYLVNAHALLSLCTFNSREKATFS